MCRRNINVHHCHSIMFGSLVLELQKLQLWPGRKSPSEIFSSLQMIEDGLKGITILLYPATMTTTVNHIGIQFDPLDHSPCLFTKDLKDRVDSVLNNVAPVVQDFHVRHLKAQQSKCAPMVWDDWLFLLVASETLIVTASRSNHSASGKEILERWSENRVLLTSLYFFHIHEAIVYTGETISLG